MEIPGPFSGYNIGDLFETHIRFLGKSLLCDALPGAPLKEWID